MSVRSPTVLGALAAIVAAAAVLRFATLGLQSYHHDEAWTVLNVLTGSFDHMLHQVKSTESNPPLYYILAWGWSRLFGLGEVGLRSLSALFGVAIVPVGYLIGRQLSGRRAGLILAAFLAFNPMMIWYSQEARSYVLLIFFAALSFYFFLRVLDTHRELDLVLWTLSSALALCSHYFAFFVIATEAVWLVFALRSRRKLMLPALIGLGSVGAALLPLLSFQTNAQHIGWISSTALVHRLSEAGAAATIGETGSVLGHPPLDGYATVPLLLAGAAVVLLLGWGRPRERRGAALATTIGFGVVALAVIAAGAGKDYVIARNLLPALVPLVAVVALGCAGERTRWVGALVATGLCVFWLAFDVHVTQAPALQRAEAGEMAARLGPAQRRRAVVSWKLNGLSLRLYFGEPQRKPKGSQLLREVDLVSLRGAPPEPVQLPRRFHLVKRIELPRYTIRRYVAGKPVRVPLGTLYDLPTGYGSNSVVVDGRLRRG